MLHAHSNSLYISEALPEIIYHTKSTIARNDSLSPVSKKVILSHVNAYMLCQDADFAS